MPPPESPHWKHIRARKGLIDTAQPIESVKDAVSKFGGSIEWKARRFHSWEARKFSEHDFEKSEDIPELRKQLSVDGTVDNEKLTMDLESTHKLIEDLKLKLEITQREERQAKQESELAKRKVEEIEQDIANEASIIAKARLEADKAAHEAVASDLKSIKEELETMHKDYASMVFERNRAVKKAEEAVATCKELEKTVGDLNKELVATKESLESTQSVHMQAEEQRIKAGMARDEECNKWKLELERAEEELQRLNQHVISVTDLKSKLDVSCAVLLDVKADLVAHLESKLKEEENHEELIKKFIEVKLNIVKGTAELNRLKEASMSLKSKLEEERSVLSAIRQSEEKASVAIASIKSELDKPNSTLTSVQMKAVEAREKMTLLMEKLQKAAKEANEAKSLAQAAQIELHEAGEEVEQVKARASEMERRVLAAQEAKTAKASKKLAIDVIKALHESESSGSNDGADSSSGVTLSWEEYVELSKRAYEANMRVTAANSQIEIAKESELRSLEKLEEVNQELAASEESLKNATEKAEKAKERKLSAEQELRMWKAEQEQQKNAGKATAAAISVHHLSKPKASVPSNNSESGSVPDKKTKKKKKKFFPRLVMFFTKRKKHSTK